MYQNGTLIQSNKLTINHTIFYTTMIDSIDLLTVVYEDFCSKYNLPHVSADEQNVNQLSQFERDWLKQFVLLWDASQEDFIAYYPSK